MLSFHYSSNYSDLTMLGSSDLLKHMSNELMATANIQVVSVKHLQDRSFSTIYEIAANHDGKQKLYILKVSTTGRSCQNEYDMYNYLCGKGIRSLTPVLYSEEFNYLVTVKEILTPFDEFVKLQRSRKQKEICFHRLGAFFADLEKSTSAESVFDKDAFESYVVPRIEQLSSFSVAEKKICRDNIETLCSQLAGCAITTSLVSDFSLGNLNVNTDEEITVLDMGDATFANRYENLSFIKLETRFGSLSQYFSFGNTSNNYFDEFMKGYEVTNIDNDQLRLHQLKHLFNMMLFISTQQSTSRPLARRLLSATSNGYLIRRYKRYTSILLRELSQ